MDLFVVPQTHHLGIALESNGQDLYSNGYMYSQMAEMWKAENATKSPIIMNVVASRVLYEGYMGTDAEFTKVSLNPPTQECWDHSIVAADRCVEDFDTRVGDPRGACEEVANPLSVAISAGLQDSVYFFSDDEADLSPAQQALKSFTISGLQIGELSSIGGTMLHRGRRHVNGQ